MKIIAHRCGTDRFPELTIAAARYSLELGADYIELDIRVTADGAFVVCHDGSARRLFGVDKKIKDIALNEFLSYRHIKDAAFPSHTMEHFLAAGIKKNLYHIKDCGRSLTDIIDLSESYDFEQEAVFGLQSVRDIEILNCYRPSIKALAFMPDPEHIEDFAKAGADYIRLWENWLTAENADIVKKTGKKLWVMSGSFIAPGYTDYENIRLWEEMGADAVLVNECEKAKNVLFHSK